MSARKNQLNRKTLDSDQGRIHDCNLCGALYSGSAELDNHKLMTHSTAGPSPHSQAAVAAEVIAVVDAADSAAEEFNAEEEDSVDDKVAIEVEATVEESCVELVMVMMRTTMWW